MDLPLDSGVDNIEVDPKTGDLWIGSHPKINQIIAYDKSMGKTLSPSQVLRVKFKDGKLSDAVEVFLDKGKRIAASTVASVYKKRLLIGSLGGPPMLCDMVYIEP
ncbi:hypothetical protein FSP39_014760 [Pinctada imbricata]|uniref:Paraoxonase n=1 Tax=Pinctada imbricata TaxID=66713 RepID=A0AA89CA23_PINIB|nr:hypothetical protein FSP39_014760 [Pinctada imbricata]